MPRSKYTVLHVVQSIGVGGAERTIQTLLKYTNSKIFRVGILNFGNNGQRAAIIRSLGFQVFSPDSKELHDFLQGKPADILHFHSDGNASPKFLRLAKQAAPSAILFGTNIFSYFDQEFDNLLDLHLFKSMMMLEVKFRRISKKSSLPHSHYRVLYNPVDTAHLSRLTLTKKEILQRKKELGIPPSAPVIGRVGRSDVVKWSDLFLETLPLLWKKVPNCHVIIRGLPQSRAPRLRSLDTEGRVHVLPETSNDEEVMATYQLLDLYVHTTKIGEAFGNTLNEAAFFERPILTHSTPHCDNGQLEQVIHGSTGFICSTPAQFAAAAAKTLENETLGSSLGKNGKKRIVSLFSPDVVTHTLESFYLEFLEKKGRVLTKSEREWKKSAKKYPNQSDLQRYQKSYNDNVTKFSQLTARESLGEILRTPNRVYWRLRDFVEFKRRSLS